ncbi:hypothetical protein ACUN8C_01665 [Kushneria sp. Sum13]|uniref:hypothetical protein n=1 Tax=Kushneria sp. Sum13 TaxID=3459196 RepID=UPI004046151A
MRSDSELLKKYRHVPDWQRSVPMRWAPSRYEVIQWRQARERQGWLNAYKFPPAQRVPIEYQALFAGQIWKGRVLLLRHSYEQTWQVHASPMWLLMRRHEVSAAVWRNYSNQ